MIWNIFWALVIGAPIAHGLWSGITRRRASNYSYQARQDRYVSDLADFEKRLAEWQADRYRHPYGKPTPPTPPTRISGWFRPDANMVTAAVISGASAFILALIIMSVGPWYDEAKADNMAPVIAQRVAVRDELAATIRDELSAEQYAALMSAAPDVDDEVDLRLYVGSGASEVLIQRASRIIELNREVYDLQGNLIARRVGVCTYLDHPLSPRLPFGIGTPSCVTPDVELMMGASKE